MNNPADIRQIILSEFRSYEQAFAAALQSDNQLLSQVLDYIHSKRGKQLRPILVLLSAALCRGVTDKTIQTAVALELMHTASLVHDDVVDDTPTRRGSNAVHTQWSNKIAILVGDYMFTRVMQILTDLRSTTILNVVYLSIACLSVCLHTHTSSQATLYVSTIHSCRMKVLLDFVYPVSCL